MSTSGDAATWRAFLRALVDEIDGVSGPAARDAMLRGVGRRMAQTHPLPASNDTQALALEMNDRLAAWGWGSTSLHLIEAERLLQITHLGLPMIGGAGDPPGTWLVAVLEGLYEAWLNALPGADRGLSILRHRAIAGQVVLKYGRI